MRRNIVSVDKAALGFVHAKSADGTWGWTWPSMIGVLLGKAESRYGPRDKDWTFLGVHFGGKSGEVWYPSAGGKNVTIRLPEVCREDPARTLFTLAHEVIHLLSPTGDKSCLLLEEGMATNFSLWANDAYLLQCEEASGAYIYARDTTKPFLDRYPDAVRNIRRIEPHLSHFTSDLLLAECPDMEPNLAARLCEPFAQVEQRLGGPDRD